MILSNERIPAAMTQGRWIIDPQPLPLRPNPDNPRYRPCQTTSVNLRLGEEIAFSQEGLAMNIDLRLGKFPDLFGPNSETRRVAPKQPFSLSPGKLALGRTLERAALPLPADGAETCLAARVEGKSSYARCGLLAHVTAPAIDAGFDGTLTLELINLGPLPILLRPNAPICRLIVEEASGVPFPIENQCQQQSRAGGQRRRRKT
jgi:dCTP deaminase